MMKRILSILFFLFTFSTIAQEEDPCHSVNDYNLLTQDANPIITKNFVQGWNMFGYTCTEDIDVIEAFLSIVDNIEIVKDNNGSVYIPEFGFNGIDNLVGGDGYQIKLNSPVIDFSFCQGLNFPIIEGCIDCEAVNYNEVASIDNGTCQYNRCDNEYACNYLQLNSECVYGSQDIMSVNQFEMFFECDYSSPLIQPYVDSLAHYNTLTDLFDVLINEMLNYTVNTNIIDSILIIDSDITLCIDFPIICEGVIPNDELEHAILHAELSATQAELNYNAERYEFGYIPATCEMIQATSNWVAYDIAVITSEGLIGINGGSCSYCSNQGENGFLIFDDDDDGDGICNSNEINGCTDSFACNYDDTATQEDNSCIYADEYYDCIGTCINDLDSNNVCDELQGCIEDVDACNYNVNAAFVEDCVYAEFGYNCDGSPFCSNGTMLMNQEDIDNFSSTHPYCTSSNIMFFGSWFGSDIFNFNGFYQIESTIGNIVIEGLENLSTLNGLENINEINSGSSIYVYDNPSLSDCSAIFPLFSTADSINISNNAEGCNSIEEVETSYYTGCLDSMACNYDSTKLYHDESVCSIPEQGYDCDGNITEYVVGMEAEGGIVFYVDGTGEHGLVAALEDIGEFDGSDASEAASNFIFETYNDWYLPNMTTLQLLYNENIGIYNGYYWSSNSGCGNYGSHYGQTLNFNDGEIYCVYKSYNPRTVLPIRPF